MAECTMYESGHHKRKSFDNSFCFARITKVNVEDRFCEIKTIGNGMTNDCHISKAQWLSVDGHPDGDESGAIPRVNTYCLVFFVNGEAFVWGSVSPLNSKGQATRDDDAKEQLSEGDRILRTVAGNKIILRSHGEIQIEATPVCKTIYYPEKQLIDTLCRNYDFKTDGVSEVSHNTNEDLGTTYYKKTFLSDMEQNAVRTEEHGTMEDGTAFFSRYQIGKGDFDDGITEVTWSQTVMPTGETELFIRAPDSDVGYRHTLNPTGETHIDIAGKTKIDVMPTGETTVNVCGKATLNIKPDGSTSLNIANKVKCKMTPAGVTTIDSSGAKAKLANNKVGFGSGGIELLAKIVEQLEKITAYCDAAQKHTHVGNLGYPTAPPTDPSPWIQLKVATDKIKGDLNKIKGGI